MNNIGSLGNAGPIVAGEDACYGWRSTVESKFFYVWEFISGSYIVFSFYDMTLCDFSAISSWSRLSHATLWLQNENCEYHPPAEEDHQNFRKMHLFQHIKVEAPIVIMVQIYTYIDFTKTDQQNAWQNISQTTAHWPFGSPIVMLLIHFEAQSPKNKWCRRCTSLQTDCVALGMQFAYFGCSMGDIGRKIRLYPQPNGQCAIDLSSLKRQAKHSMEDSRYTK